MMPNTLWSSTLRTLYDDRLSPELRRYARDEWRLDGPWVRSQIPSVPLRERLGRWVRRRRATTTKSPAPLPESPSPVASKAAARDAEPPCPHLVRESLGLGGAAVFLRCCACGGVLVVSENRAWSLVPPETSAAAEPLRA